MKKLYFSLAIIFFCSFFIPIYYHVSSFGSNRYEEEDILIIKSFSYEEKEDELISTISQKAFSQRFNSNSDTWQTIGLKSVSKEDPEEVVETYYYYRGPSSNGTFSNIPESNYVEAPGNRYDDGWCTWYVYNRRAEIGKPLGNTLWGDAYSWVQGAIRDGYTVDHNPQVGDVMFTPPTHVVVVEKVDKKNNRVYVSETNYCGLYCYNERWFENADQYYYIH